MQMARGEKSIMKMKGFVTLILIGFFILSGLSEMFIIHKSNVPQIKSVVVHPKITAESDTFTYDGTNASSYNMEPIFAITDKANADITDDIHSYQIGSDLYEIKNKLKSVKSIIVNDNATKLYFRMLKYFTDATKLHIGKNVNTIHMDNAEDFFGEDYMKALSTIEVDKENSYFKVKDNVLYSDDMKTLFLYPIEKKDTSFSIPDSVTKFAGGYNVRNGYLLKLNFGKLFGSLDTPYDVPSIAAGLSSLQQITVDVDNVRLSAVDGVLYNKEQTKMISWPQNLVMEHVTFPSTLQLTALHLISNADQVKTITLSKNMEELWVFDFTSRLHAFTKLQKVSVPSENKYFTVWKGGLYNKKKTIFYGFPQESPLHTLEFPKGITVIELWYNVYSNIEKVIFPSTFTKFYTHEGGGFTRFHGMFPKLKSVQISSKCKYYKSVDGVVYNKKGTKVIYNPKE